MRLSRALKIDGSRGIDPDSLRFRATRRRGDFLVAHRQGVALVATGDNAFGPVDVGLLGLDNDLVTC